MVHWPLADTHGWVWNEQEAQVPEISQWSDIEPEVDGEPASRNSVMVVYRAIKRKILSGEVKSGELLPQSRLATEFNTSRGPVREALRLLQREGLIDAETNQRARVASFDAGDLEQVAAALVLNVSAAIYVSAERLSASESASIIVAIDRIEKLASSRGRARGGKLAREEQRQMAFHQLVALLCRRGGQPAAHIVESLFDQIAIFRRMGSVRVGEPTSFPLPDELTGLRRAVLALDPAAIALSVVSLIEHLAHFAFDRIAQGYDAAILDSYIALVKRAIGRAGASNASDVRVLPQGMTLAVRNLPNGRVGYSIVSE